MTHPILLNCDTATKLQLICALEALAVEWNQPGRGHEAHELGPSRLYGDIKSALQDRFNDSHSIVLQNFVFVVVKP